MQSLSQLMGNTTQADVNYSSMTEEEKVQHFVDVDNARPGDLNKDGFNCKLCLNKGWIAVVQKESKYITQATKLCECLEVRKMIHNAKASGMGDLLDHKLKNFTTNEEWQKQVLNLANHYLSSDLSCWFAVLGQSGAGKTMICSAVANQLLKKYKKVKFVTWTEFTEKLKRMRFDAERDDYFEGFSQVEVLYIDDFLKGSITHDENGRLKANATDVKYAFQLINERYNKRLTTIISSEYLIDDIREYVDEAIAGRINERCKEFCLQIRKDKSKNYRFKQGVIL
ncbi:MAG: ATP-binding protein [Turicibacter sp.]|nr:ATP-binding protein [Turicibacter sp.]